MVKWTYAAEAVADLVASESESARQVAMHQMRGGFSNELKELRQELIQLLALIELSQTLVKKM